MRSNQTKADETYGDEALTISPEQVCFIIVKAREFDVKDADSELESGSNASDDQMISVLEDRRDDPVQQELASFIENMTEDEQIDLVALAWLGRDDGNTIEDWPSIRDEAASHHRSRAGSTARYLLGTPLLSDYLEEGLSMFGKSCEQVETGRL